MYIYISAAALAGNFLLRGSLAESAPRMMMMVIMTMKQNRMDHILGQEDGVVEEQMMR